MLEQLRDWNKESSAFSYLWTCDDKPFCRRKDIPNWPRIYQHPWCILPRHWKSPHTCDSCVQRSISQDQRTKHHPQTATWRALRVNIVNYILVYTEIIVSSFFSQEIRYSQRWSPRIGKWHFEVHKNYFLCPCCMNSFRTKCDYISDLTISEKSGWWKKGNHELIMVIELICLHIWSEIICVSFKSKECTARIIFENINMISD